MDAIKPLEETNRSLAFDIQRGDPEAFAVLYHLEFNNLTHFILSYIHDATVTEDLVQDTFCTVWEKRTKIDCTRNLRAFIYTIARHKAINWLKAEKHSGHTLSHDCAEAELIALEDASLDEQIDGLELEKLIQTVYRQLPDSARDSFIMSRQVGMSNREIAKKKGLSTKAIEYHITISLRLFRNKLKDYLTSL